MKVLEVQDCFYPSVDGPIEVMLSIARKFKENGLGEVEVLVPSYPKKVDVEGVKIHRCKSLPTQDGYRAALPWLGSKVKKVIKNGGYDVIHLHSPFILGRYALKLGKKYNIPVVITVHTKFRDEFQTRLKSKFLQKFILKYILKCIDGCDGITTVSHGMIDTMRDYGSKRCGDVKVIYNATSMPPSATDAASVDELRENLGLNGNVAFVFAGRLVEAKNVQFSLNALAEVKKRGYSNFKFVIIGDGAYGKTLKKLTVNLGLEENVIFVGKITDRKLLAEYYAASDVLLFPSIFDNASIALMESAANSLPAATIKDSCSAERIEDGVSGFVWGNDISVWADNIIKLINDDSLVKTASEGALQKVYVGWDSIAREYYELFKGLIK